MQFIHRVSAASSAEVRKELAALGIIVGAADFVSFDFDEAHPAWPQLQRWIAKRRAVDILSTRFSQPEIAAALWLELEPSWHHGFPQPDHDAGYLEVSYDTSDYCPQCGVGLRQKAPFRMKAEPKWGRNGILQLNWIFDEYFATPAVATSVFEPLGVRHRPVLDKKGNELKTVVQIVVDAEVDIVTDGLTPEKCGRCSRLKYAPAVRGYFPPLAESVTGDIARTRQYFGSGASASKRILVARRLASALQSAMVRGVSLRPLAHSSPRPLAQSD